MTHATLVPTRSAATAACWMDMALRERYIDTVGHRIDTSVVAIIAARLTPGQLAETISLHEYDHTGASRPLADSWGHIERDVTIREALACCGAGSNARAMKWLTDEYIDDLSA